MLASVQQHTNNVEFPDRHELVISQGAFYSLKRCLEKVATKTGSLKVGWALLI